MTVDRTAGTKFDFHFDEALRGRGVTGAYSLLLGIDQSLTPPEEITAFVDGVIAGVRERAVRDLITADPVYAGFRELHKSFEVPTRKLLSAAETLIRYVEKRDDIPRIGPLVDVYNAVSLETKLSLGAHDLDAVTGSISGCRSTSQGGGDAVAVARSTATPFSCSSSSTRSSHPKSYSPGRSSSRAHAKTPTVTRLTPASRMRASTPAMTRS